MKRAILLFRASVAKRMVAVATLVLLCALIAVPVRAEGTAPEIVVEAGNVAPMEPITVRFRNTPGNSNDWITLVPEGTPDGKYREWKWVSETAGTLVFRGVEEGLYEIRFHLKGTHEEPTVRLLVSVGNVAAAATADPPDGEQGGEDGEDDAPEAEAAAQSGPTIRTSKDIYSGRETIEVSFSGANGAGDVIMIAPVGAPADQGFWYRLARGETEGKREISWKFSGNFRGDHLFNGTYEARLFLKDEPEFIAHQFTIQGDQERPDSLDGVWQGDALCGRYEKTEVSMFVTDLGETRYAALRLVDRSNDDESITHYWYQLGDDGDHEGDFITPEFVYGALAHKFRIFNADGKDRIVVEHVVCGDLAMQRVEPAQPVGAPGPFNKKWAGYVDACSYFTNFPYDVEFAFSELPTGVVLAKARTPFGRGMTPHPFFYGEYSAGKDTITFRPTSGNGKKEQLWLEFVKDEGRIFGKAEWLFGRGICDYIELSPKDVAVADADPAAPPAAPATSADADAADRQVQITGGWEGTATCGGEPARLLLNLRDAPADRYAGSVEYAFADVLSTGVLTQKLVGERVGDGSYRFAIDTPRRSPQLPAGAPAPGGFLLSAGGAGAERIEATYPDESCTEVVLSKLTAGRVAEPVRGGNPEGTFYAKRRPRERCEAVSEWLGRMDEEYPGTDFWRSSSRQNTRRLVLLLADDDFVPVFGYPYDRLSGEDTKQIAAEVQRLCRGDPISRELISNFRLVAHFFAIAGRDVGAVSGASVRSLIRETRRIRNLVDEVGRNLSETASFEEAVPVLTDLRDQVNAAAEFLWPREIESTTQHLTNRLGSYAAVEADAHHQRIIALPDHIAQLKALTAVARGETDYHEYLLQNDRQRIHETVIQDQIAIVERTYGPQLASLRALQPSLVALSQLADLQAELTPVLSLLTSEVAQAFTGEIEEKRQALFDTLASERIAELAQFTADREGIQKSKGWIEDFEDDFSAFEGTTTYRRAVNRYAKVRSGILREAVSHFEIELAEGQSAQTNPDDLVREYLSSEGDARLPISLQYLIMAEVAKHDSHRMQDDVASDPALDHQAGAPDAIADVLQEHNHDQGRPWNKRDEVQSLDHPTDESAANVETLEQEIEALRSRADAALQPSPIDEAGRAKVKDFFSAAKLGGPHDQFTYRFSLSGGQEVIVALVAGDFEHCYLGVNSARFLEANRTYVDLGCDNTFDRAPGIERTGLAQGFNVLKPGKAIPQYVKNAFLKSSEAEVETFFASPSKWLTKVIVHDYDNFQNLFFVEEKKMLWVEVTSGDFSMAVGFQYDAGVSTCTTHVFTYETPLVFFFTPFDGLAADVDNLTAIDEGCDGLIDDGIFVEAGEDEPKWYEIRKSGGGPPGALRKADRFYNGIFEDYLSFFLSYRAVWERVFTNAED